MTWWGWTLIGLGLGWLIFIEVRRYRTFNSSSSVVKPTKKSPPQADAGTGIEYGGHHLP